MTELEAPDGSGGATSTSFVDGTSIQWGRLALTIVGGAFAAAWAAGIDVVLAIGDAITGLLDGAADWAGAFVGELISSPAATMAAGVESAVAFVGGAGLGGYVLAIAFVLTMLYIVERVIDR